MTKGDWLAVPERVLILLEVVLRYLFGDGDARWSSSSRPGSPCSCGLGAIVRVSRRRRCGSDQIVASVGSPGGCRGPSSS